MLLNLLSNAVKFTDRDGTIIINIKIVDQEYLQIAVIDNGCGIKKKHQGKLFKLFGSIKNEKLKFNVKGIGLGLVISKMIVNKFGGEIDFVSKFKRGTTFFYTFMLEEFKE